MKVKIVREGQAKVCVFVPYRYWISTERKCWCWVVRFI